MLRGVEYLLTRLPIVSDVRSCMQGSDIPDRGGALGYTAF